MRKISVSSIFLLASLAMAFCFSLGASAQEGAHITVIGTAQARLVPDVAHLAFGVQVRKSKASEALDDATKAARDMKARIEAQGIDPADIQTVSIVLVPAVSEKQAAADKAMKAPKEYIARQIVEIHVRAIDKIGALARQLFDDGDYEFQGIRFGLAHENEVDDKLRAEAMHDAQRRAKIYAEAAGMKLGRVLEIVTQQSNSPKAEETPAKAPPPGPLPMVIEPGTRILEKQVQVTWGIIP